MYYTLVMVRKCTREVNWGAFLGRFVVVAVLFLLLFFSSFFGGGRGD